MIKVVGRNQSETRLEKPCTVQELLDSLHLKEQNHICLRNGIPVTRMDTVNPDDDVTIMEIFSGGA